MYQEEGIAPHRNEEEGRASDQGKRSQYLGGKWVGLAIVVEEPAIHTGLRHVLLGLKKYVLIGHFI